MDKSNTELDQMRYQASLPSLHPTPYTLHPTPCTLHPTPYTLHPTPYTLHPLYLSISLSLSLSFSRSLLPSLSIPSLPNSNTELDQTRFQASRPPPSLALSHSPPLHPVPSIFYLSLEPAEEQTLPTRISEPQTTTTE